MARPSDISDDELLAAASELRACSRSVTGSGLREKLGRGAPTSLVRRWAELSGAVQPTTTVAAQLPAGLAASIDEAMTRIREGVVTCIQQRSDEQRQDQARADALHRERIDAAEKENEALSALLIEADMRIAASDAELAVATVELENRLTRWTALQDQLDARTSELAQCQADSIALEHSSLPSSQDST
ncbi:DNA-binding protein [Frigidibacter sp. MR17.24]|uniref:DNA-binding protein n=1 Tax=Frigidibacter sp. MR17.24 TaxID=3127345 RepID=UPI003012E41D